MISLAARGIRLVLLDIEGTTTPIAFVHDVLFPYARTHLAAWLSSDGATAEFTSHASAFHREHAADVARGEAVPPWRADDVSGSVAAYVEWLMDRDRKSPALKWLQGVIWERGYQRGDLHGVVYDDVPPAMRAWRAAGVGVAIYSSGSELAQRRLFASTSAGDLTPLIVGFFDTAVGPKGDAASYERIAAALGCPPAAMLFVSDVTRELSAAAAAGCQVALSLRPGNPPQADADRVERLVSFAEIG